MMMIMCTLLMTVVFVWKGAERSVPVSTMTAALDARYLSAPNLDAPSADPAADCDLKVS